MYSDILYLKIIRINEWDIQKKSVKISFTTYFVRNERYFRKTVNLKKYLTISTFLTILFKVVLSSIK